MPKNKEDVQTWRAKHKLRLDILDQEEWVLCKGTAERFEITRFFWKNVDCEDCLKLKPKPGIIDRVLKFLSD